jgi:hypothetical protein
MSFERDTPSLTEGTSFQVPLFGTQNYDWASVPNEYLCAGWLTVMFALVSHSRAQDKLKFLAKEFQRKNPGLGKQFPDGHYGN